MSERTSLLKERQETPVESEVFALIAIIRPILKGILYSLKGEVVESLNGHEKIKLREMTRVYRQGSGDCGICFEYAVHDAVTRGEPSVLERVDDALKKCRINGGEPRSILFGAEKNGAVQLIQSANELLTDNSRVLAGVQGQPPKLKRHLGKIRASFRSKSPGADLPWSIAGLWRADLFVGRTAPDQWVGVTVKINQTHLEADQGLRIGIVPCGSGKTDLVRHDAKRNLIICPIPHDRDFMELFYSAWAIVTQFIKADAQLPGEVYLPSAAHRQACRFLVERREFPVLDVIDALEPLSQPGLLVTELDRDDIMQRRAGIEMTAGRIIAPVPCLNKI